MLEPARRKLIGAIGHVLAAENAVAKHLGWRQIRLELRIEVATSWFDEFVAVIPLHPIIDCDRSSHLQQADNARFSSGGSSNRSSCCRTAVFAPMDSPANPGQRSLP
jgi:hypothetical protein